MPTNNKNYNKKLDKKTLEGYRKILLKMKEDLTQDIKQMSSDSASAQKDSPGQSGHAMHIADVATDMYDREFHLGLASNDRELVYKVDKALNRIKEGTYGNCQECTKPIAVARLKALPYTETCLKCQEALETKVR